MKKPLFALLIAGCASNPPPCDPDAPGTICTIAGTGLEAVGGNSNGTGVGPLWTGPALDAYFGLVEDTVIAPNGDLWIEDFNNYLVRAVDSEGQLHTVIGSGVLGDSPAPGEGCADPTDPTCVATCPALQAEFNHTTSIAFVNDGTDTWLYMASWHSSRVKRVNYATMMVENYAGIGVRTRYSGDEGPALAAAVDLPTSIAADPDGNITIMDQANQVIRQVDHAGNIHRLAGNCVIELAACDGAAPTQCPNSDKDVCGNPDEYCGMDGSLYGTNDCTGAFAGDGGPAIDLRMSQDIGQVAPPGGRIAYDPDGNLLFADKKNNRIRKINKSDNSVSTIAGTGDAAYSGDGGPATAAAINLPIDLAVAPDGTIYFADTGNSCIRKIDTSGIISTVAGMCSPTETGFSGDGGPPTKAQLNQAAGIDLVGNKLYISDTYNSRVRVVNL